VIAYATMPRTALTVAVDIAAYKDYPGYADRFKSNAAAAWDEAP
jgi:hypothetical protein